MKQLIVFAFISTCLFSFGQTNMFWNNYSNFNPAMSGFEYQQHGALTSIESWKSNKGIESLHANYNQRIFGQHGVGINYSGYFNIFAGHFLTANYNYQFDLKKAGKLSAGVAIGGSNIRLREEYLDILDSGQVFNPRNNFLLNLGVAYKWKNLLVGVATSDLTVANTEYVNPPEFRLVYWNAFASYDFKIRRNFELTPRINFRTQPGNPRPATYNLTATFHEKYAVGISFYPNQQWGINLGWDISNRFRVAYMVSQRIYLNSAEPLSNNYRSHEFSIGYLIKKPKSFCGTGNPPR